MEVQIFVRGLKWLPTLQGLENYATNYDSLTGRGATVHSAMYCGYIIYVTKGAGSDWLIRIQRLTQVQFGLQELANLWRMFGRFQKCTYVYRILESPLSAQHAIIYLDTIAKTYPAIESRGEDEWKKSNVG